MLNILTKMESKKADISVVVLNKIISQYMASVFNEAKNRPLYLVKEYVSKHFSDLKK